MHMYNHAPSYLEIYVTVVSTVDRQSTETLVICFYYVLKEMFLVHVLLLSLVPDDDTSHTHM